MAALITRSNPPAVHEPTGYTHAVRVSGDTRRLIVSGQVGMALDGTVPTSGEGQIAQAFANLRAVLAANGMGVENIVKTTIFLTDRGCSTPSAPPAPRCSESTPRPPPCCSSPGWPIPGSWWRSKPKRWRKWS